MLGAGYISLIDSSHDLWFITVKVMDFVLEGEYKNDAKTLLNYSAPNPRHLLQ